MREVDNAVRQDQFGDASKKYGIPAAIIVVLGLAALLAYILWDGQREAELERQSEALVSALDNIEAGNLDTGAAVLEPVVAGGDGGVAAVARMLQAGIAIETNKPGQAAQIFSEVAANPDTPPALRDLAQIRAVSVQYDRMKPADIIAQLKPLAVPGNAFFGSAGELVAMAYLEQGKRAEAGALFAQIAKDKTVPEGLRSRTRQMAGLLGVDAIEDVDAVLAESLTEAGPPTPSQ